MFTDLLSGAGGLGGLSGGLGGAGGVGGGGSGYGGASSSASASSEAHIEPSIALGARGDTIFTLGPFAPVFPGAYPTGIDSINAPVTGKIGNTIGILAAVGLGVLLMFYAFKS